MDAAKQDEKQSHRNPKSLERHAASHPANGGVLRKKMGKRRIFALATILALSGGYMAVRLSVGAEREIAIPETPSIPAVTPIPPIQPIFPEVNSTPATSHVMPVEFSDCSDETDSTVVPVPESFVPSASTGVVPTSATLPLLTDLSPASETTHPAPVPRPETVPSEAWPTHSRLTGATESMPELPNAREGEKTYAGMDTDSSPLVPLGSGPDGFTPRSADPFRDPFFADAPQPMALTILGATPVMPHPLPTSTPDTTSIPAPLGPVPDEELATGTGATMGSAVDSNADTAHTDGVSAAIAADPVTDLGTEIGSETSSGTGSSFSSPGTLSISAPRQFEEQLELAAVEGTAKPGETQFDGLQKPQVILEKILPDEVIVGNTTSIRLVVRNPSDRPLRQVVVRDEVPERTRFAGSTPQAQQDGRTGLLWDLGTLEGGEERAIEIQLVPLREGEFGSVATVTFACPAGGRSRAVQPRLAVNIDGPKQVLIGQEAKLSITVTNEGTGTARNVFLLEHVPEGLRHMAGDQLENQLGDLRPGESQVVELSLMATGVGPVKNPVVVRGDGGLVAERSHSIEILAPALDVAATGARRRFLKRETTYSLSISNPGTADAMGVTFSTVLPAGLEFVGTNNEGIFDPQTRVVKWSLEKLPAGETGDVELVVMPTEAGEKSLRITGAALNVSAIEKQMPITIEGVGAFGFEVTDLADPVELGGETVYRITLFNNGSKEVTGIRMTAGLSAGLELISIEGAVSGKLSGSQITFDEVSSLMPEVMQQVLVRVRAKEPGDQRLRVQVRTNDVSQPVTKEETTRVFAD